MGNNGVDKLQELSTTNILRQALTANLKCFHLNPFHCESA